MQGADVSLEQSWFFGLLAVLAVVSCAAAIRWRTRLLQVPRHLVLGVGAATLVALVIRVFFVAPAFVHIGLHGPLILESIIAFPEPHTYRSEFGPGGFVVLGAFAALFGRDAETVMIANAVLSALMTPLVAVVAARWSLRTSAGLYAAAAWATSPFVARLARSEDVHVVGLFFVLLSFAWVELAVSRRSNLALAGAVVSMLLSLWTRQTMYPFAVMLVLILLEHRYRSVRAALPALSKLQIALTSAAIVVPLLVRLGFTFSQGGDSMIVPVLLELLRNPILILQNLFIHPLFSPARLSILFPTVGILGTAYLCMRSPIRVSFALIAAGILFESLPSAYRSLGVSWAFRMPIYTLAILAIGAGGAAIEEFFAKRRPGFLTPRISLALPALCAVIGLVGSATIENRQQNAEFVEYTYLRDTLRALPRPFTLVTLDLYEPASSLPASLARNIGIPVTGVKDDPFEAPVMEGPAFFYAGIACHAHSLPALFEASLPSGKATDDDIHHFLVDAHDPTKNFGSNLALHPAKMHHACAELITKATAKQPGPKVEVEDDPPMVLFDAHDVELGFFKLPSQSKAR